MGRRGRVRPGQHRADGADGRAAGGAIAAVVEERGAAGREGACPTRRVEEREGRSAEHAVLGIEQREVVLARVERGLEAIADAAVAGPGGRHPGATVVLPVPGEVLDTAGDVRAHHAIRGQGGIVGGVGAARWPPGRDVGHDDHLGDPGHVAAVDDVAAGRVDAAAHAAHQPGSPLEGDAVDAGHDGYGRDRAGQVGGGRGEEDEPRRRRHRDPALGRRQLVVHPVVQVVVERRNAVGVEEADRVAEQDEPVRVEPAQVDPVLEPVTGDRVQRRVDPVRGAVATGDLGEVVREHPARDRGLGMGSCAHRDVPRRDAAVLPDTGRGRGDRPGRAVEVKGRARRPVEGHVVDAGGAGRVGARDVAADGRRRPGDLLRTRVEDAVRGLRRLAAERGHGQQDRERRRDLPRRPQHDVACAHADGAGPHRDLLAGHRVDLEQGAPRQQAAIKAGAPLGQGPLAAVGRQVHAAITADGGDAEECRQPEQQRHADQEPGPRCSREAGPPGPCLSGQQRTPSGTTGLWWTLAADDMARPWAEEARIGGDDRGGGRRGRGSS